eukprot:TRINITY_DN7429_c0_g1_i4.p1 TRINITY_DN7429_c0_g1~~TRINITY_DN7429_c0_g1_i4.p1  ORF type:complete len:145 (-),score=21.60 TRINITY_DN7429_c0_g1_i4:148-582(-)
MNRTRYQNRKKEKLELRTKQLEVMERELSCINEQLSRASAEKSELMRRYEELFQRQEQLDEEIEAERREKSLMFAQLQALEVEYDKVKGSQKGGEIVDKIMVSLKLQHQEPEKHPKKPEDIPMSSFSLKQPLNLSLLNLSLIHI